MPPRLAMSGAYLHCPTRHVVRSRHVSMFVKSKASGPVISTIRSTATSQTVTSLSSAQYSVTGSS